MKEFKVGVTNKKNTWKCANCEILAKSWGSLRGRSPLKILRGVCQALALKSELPTSKYATFARNFDPHPMENFQKT